MSLITLRVENGAKAPKAYRVWVTSAEPAALSEPGLYVDLLRSLKADLQAMLRTSAAESAAARKTKAGAGPKTSVVNDVWAYTFQVPDAEEDARATEAPGLVVVVRGSAPASAADSRAAPQHAFDRLDVAPFEIKVRLHRRVDVAAALGSAAAASAASSSSSGAAR